MNYEKEYKETFERAQKIYNDIKNDVIIGFPEQITYIFPNINDSEDERIRKALIWHLKAGEDFVSNGVTKEQTIAYLEKQKERDLDIVPELRPTAWGEGYQHGCKDTEKKLERVINASRRVLNNWLDGSDCPDVSGDFAELEYAIREYDGEEKQKEQKTTSFNEPYNPDDYEVVMEGNATSVKMKKQKECVADSRKTSASEDERIRKAALEGIEYLEHNLGWDAIGDTDILDVKEYIEKQKEPHYTKRNALFDKCVENCDPAVMKEVNKRVDDIMNMPELSAFEQALTNFIGYWEDDEEHWPSQFVKKHGKHILDMAREELQKEQKPAEWSDEDEEMIGCIIDDIREAKRNSDKEYFKELCDKEIAWLKSLRPSWKPNDKDEERLIKTSIVFLKDFADMGYENAVECIDWLKSKLNGNTCK